MSIKSTSEPLLKPLHSCLSIFSNQNLLCSRGVVLLHTHADQNVWVLLIYTSSLRSTSPRSGHSTNMCIESENLRCNLRFSLLCTHPYWTRIWNGPFSTSRQHTTFPLPPISITLPIILSISCDICCIFYFE